MNNIIKIALISFSFFSISTASLATEFSPREPGTNSIYFVGGNWLELQRGWNTLKLKITASDESVVTGADVTVNYDMLGHSMHPPIKPVIEVGDGVYEKQVFLGMRGAWKFDTHIQKDATEDTHSKTQDVPN